MDSGRAPFPSTFNGAMAFQPWIPDMSDQDPLEVVPPSMEPWPFSHGYVTSSVATSSCKSLQWSHGLSAMDTWRAGLRRMPKVSLQWSHGLSAMDTSQPNSNSPARTTLQWSHGLSAMDTRVFPARHSCGGCPSMEPWPFSHGYSGNSGTPSLYHTGRVFDSRVRRSPRPMSASVAS